MSGATDSKPAPSANGALTDPIGELKYRHRCALTNQASVVEDVESDDAAGLSIAQAIYELEATIALVGIVLAERIASEPLEETLVRGLRARLAHVEEFLSSDIPANNCEVFYPHADKP